MYSRKHPREYSLKEHTMAQRTQVILVDDISGETLEGGETVSFGLDGTSYEIDLGKENADALRDAFKKYTEAARKVGSTGTRRRAAATGNSRSDSDREKTQAIRTWAKENGHEVSERGRIKASVVEAYEAAH